MPDDPEKLRPRCPYCGTEMRIIRNMSFGEELVFWECPGCDDIIKPENTPDEERRGGYAI